MKKAYLNNKYRVYAATVTLLLLITGCLGVAGARLIHAHGKGSDIILYINNEPVTVNEFKKIMDRNKPYIYQEFREKNIAFGSKDFWYTNFDGYIPVDALKEKSKKQIIRIKIQQIMARDRNIIKDISYGNMLKELERFNNDRKKAVKEKRIVYGPVEYTEDNYFDKILGDIVYELKKKIMQEKNFSDEKLRLYYDENKEYMFKRIADIKVKRLTVEFPERDLELKKTALSLIKDIKTKVERGEAFESIKNSFAGNNTIAIKITDQIFNHRTIKMDGMRWPGLLDEAKKLEAGNISGVVELPGSFDIIKCIEKSKQEYKPFGEVKELIKMKLAEKEYDAMVGELSENAQVKTSKDIYNQDNMLLSP